MDDEEWLMIKVVVFLLIMFGFGVMCDVYNVFDFLPIDRKVKTVKRSATEPTVCRVYINQNGMLDITSPEGTVEVYTVDNNLEVPQLEVHDHE